MYQRIRKRYCRLVIVLALVLRLATETAVLAPLVHGLDTLRNDPAFISLMHYLGSGERIAVPEDRQPGTVTLIRPAGQPPAERETPAQTVTAFAPFDFSRADAAAIPVSGSCTYAYDKQALLEQPLQADLTEDGPKILIVHTHGCEAYTPTEGWEYEPDGSFRTADPERSVIRVGTEMQSVFEAAGIETIHITDPNDSDGFTGAYDRMEGTIETCLAEHPSICMVLDIHRDSYENADGSPAAPVCTTPDGTAARLMLVMGSDEGGLYHPHWQDNLSCALKVQALLEEADPGICRTMLLRQSRYNQHLTPCSLLVEVGATGNSLPEAILGGRRLAEAIVRLLEQADPQ